MTTEEKTAYEYEVAFHFETYTFDLDHDFPDLESSFYSADAIDAFLTKALVDPDEYTYLIDTYLLNTVKPVMKCNSPCLTCLESDPDYCTSCWGVGEDK